MRARLPADPQLIPTGGRTSAKPKNDRRAAYAGDLSAEPARVQLVTQPETVALGKLGLDRAADPSTIGQARPVDSTVADAGVWETLPDGRRAWRVAINSESAVGLRVHFVGFEVGED